MKANIIISGPGVEGRAAPTVGAGISGALTFACRADRRSTFYVREQDRVVARVERDENGVIEARRIA